MLKRDIFNRKFPEEGILVVFLIALNILMRIPVIPHEFGADSFFIHMFAKQVAEQHYAPWIIHPLSFFGLYPLSNASVVPILIGMLSVITGISVEGVILVSSTVFSILGMLSAYALAGKIKNTVQFKFLAAFLFSVSPIALKFTGWTISTRGLFIMFTPLFLWVIIRDMTKQKTSFVSLLIGLTLLITLAGIHKIFVILLPVIILISFTNIIKKSFNKAIKPTLVVGLFVFLFFIQFFLYAHWWPYWNIPINLPRSVVFRIAALLIEFFMRLGLVFPLSVIGLICLIFNRRQEPLQLYIILISLFFTPFLSYDMYFYQTLFIVWIILSVYGFEKILLVISNQKLRSLMLVILLMFNIVFTCFTEFYRFTKIFPNMAHQYLDTHLQGTVSFLNGLESGVISNYGSNSQSYQIAAFSNKPSLPTRGPELFGYGLVDEGDIKMELREIPKTVYELKYFAKYPFQYTYGLLDYETKYIVVNKFDYPDFEILNNSGLYDNGYERVLLVNNG